MLFEPCPIITRKMLDLIRTFLVKTPLDFLFEKIFSGTEL